LIHFYKRIKCDLSIADLALPKRSFIFIDNGCERRSKLWV